MNPAAAGLNPLPSLPALIVLLRISRREIICARQNNA
jgi:hypothetical protein